MKRGVFLSLMNWDRALKNLPVESLSEEPGSGWIRDPYRLSRVSEYGGERGAAQAYGLRPSNRLQAFFISSIASFSSLNFLMSNSLILELFRKTV